MDHQRSTSKELLSEEMHDVHKKVIKDSVSLMYIMVALNLLTVVNHRKQSNSRTKCVLSVTKAVQKV